MPTVLLVQRTLVPALVAVTALTLMPSLALLAADAPADEIAKLRATLTELQSRVETLEQDTSHDENLDVPRLTIKGFADLTWRMSRERRDGVDDANDNHFALGQFDLFFSSRLTDNTSFLGEMVVETKDDGSTGVDLERAIIKYTISDHFNVQAGRFHTTLGYWNETFHHGAWLQTTIDRPAALNFEDGGGVLPVHLVGVLAKSHHVVGDMLGIDGTVEIGNGRGPTADPPQVIYDGNDSKAINLSVSLAPLSVPGLRVGGGMYFDRIPAYIGDVNNPAHSDLQEQVLNGYLVYRARPYELIAEYYRIAHKATDGSGATAVSDSYYVQVGYQLGRFTPYARYDTLRISDSDTYFSSQDDTSKTAIGIRYEVNAWAALKLQGNEVLIHPAGGGADIHRDELVIQISSAF